MNDALAILAAVDGIALDDDQQQLVGLLALVAGQDVEEGDQPGSWRIARKVAYERVISTVDPETRHMHKSRSEYRDGFKAHLAIEPDTGLITGVDLTAANAPDGAHGIALLDGEPAGLDVLADSAYGTGPARAALADAGHTAIIKPWPLARNPNLGSDQFTRDDFTIDYTARTVTCPNGLTVAIAPKGSADFGPRCTGCPLRSRCTANKAGRTIHVGKHDRLLADARRAWRDGERLDDYRQHRPMVERSIAWLVTNGHRRVRYRGIERNRNALTIRAATINLRRLLNLGLNWNNGWQLAPS